MFSKKSWIAVIGIGVCIVATSHVVSQDANDKAPEGMPAMSAEDMAHMQDEPQLGVHGRTVKYVTAPTDAVHFSFTIIDLHAGDDYKVIEIDYTRRK